MSVLRGLRLPLPSLDRTTRRAPTSTPGAPTQCAVREACYDIAKEAELYKIEDAKRTTGTIKEIERVALVFEERQERFEKGLPAPLLSILAAYFQIWLVPACG